MIRHPWKVYRSTDESPSIPFEIEDPTTGAALDLSTGATFTMDLLPYPDGTVAYTKSSGIAGDDAYPNAVAVWAVGELATVPAGRWYCRLSYTVGGRQGTLDPDYWPLIIVG